MKSGSKNVVENLFQIFLDFVALGQIYNGEIKSGTGKMNTCVSVESMGKDSLQRLFVLTRKLVTT